MKPRGLLFPTCLLLSALACNLPFASPPQALVPSSTPLIPPTSSPAPTSTLPPSSSPTTSASTALLPSPTQAFQLTATPTAAASMALFNPYAVILVPANDVLNARLMPGANNTVVGTLPPGATGIELTGKQAFVGDDHWVGVFLPGGRAGWVNAYYLTEQVPSAVFCTDPQITPMVASLRQALIDRNGALLSSLVSPAHGLEVSYLHNGNHAHYSPEEAGWLFQSDYVMDWGLHPASGLPVKGAFRETVLPDLLDVLAADFQLQCNRPDLGGGNYTYVWPERYHNINYLVLHRPGTPGAELDWRTWIAGVEYVQGRPYLFALVHLFWEP